MKTLIGAIALILAAPLAAQAAPAADPHAGHGKPAQHQGMDHGKMNHGEAGHDKDCCKPDCCAEMKRQGKAMDCCKKAAAKSGEPKAADHSGHGDHDH